MGRASKASLAAGYDIDSRFDKPLCDGGVLTIPNKQAVAVQDAPVIAERPLRPSRVASIEVCRGVAATMVLTYHSGVILGAPANFAFSPFGQFFHFGRSGVDFFFVLSGFLISLLHWRDIGKPDRLKRYAVRRLTRIYPTYWLVLLPIIPVDVFTHTLFDDYSKPLEVLKSILLLPQDHTILDVTWSLRNELLFYVLFGLMIFSRRAGIIVVGVWIIALVARPFAIDSLPDAWLNLLTYPMNIEFLAGVAAGWAYPRIHIARPALLLGFGLAMFAGLWFAEDRLWLLRLSWDRFFLVCVAYGVAASAVILSLSTLETDRRIRMPGALVTLGGASYLLYLIHVPALLVLGASERVLHLSQFLPTWSLAAAFIVITIVVAMIAHRWIEKPLLRVVRHRAETATL